MSVGTVATLYRRAGYCTVIPPTASTADVQPMDAEEAVQLVTEETAPMEVDVVCDDEISIYGEDELRQMEEADLRWIRERCEARFGPHPDNATGGNGGNVIVESVDIDTVVYQPETRAPLPDRPRTPEDVPTRAPGVAGLKRGRADLSSSPEHA